MVIVRKKDVGYPQVWKGKSAGVWKFGEKCDGIFMQLDCKTARAVFFTTLEKDKKTGKLTFGDTSQIDAEEFSLFPPLFH